MAFGLPTGGGSSEITPFIKYNAKAGRMIRVDRVQGANGYESQDNDITDSFQAVLDLENIQVGWVYYGAAGPQRAMAIYKKEPTPVRPSDTDDKGKSLYKSGFTVKLALAKSAGGGIREFGSSASCVVEAMGALFDLYELAPEARDRMLPVVKMSGVVTEKGQYGTNYRPKFEIIKWVDRPDGLGAPAAKTAAPQPQRQLEPAGAAPSTGSTLKAPPAQQQTAAAPEADADDFG